MAAKMPTAGEVQNVATRLSRAYPYVAARKRAEGVLDEPPLDSLVRAILSQNTNDRNRDLAFAELRCRFATWEEVAMAPLDAVIEAIHATNYAPTKAGRIQQILTRLHAEWGKPTLEPLRAWPTARILAYLQSFPGVGRKSAAIVALFALRRPVVPVDTHVYRVTQRLSWIDEHTSIERAHDELQRIIPEELVLPLHMGLWEHGRVTCRPTPRCGQCAIYAFCLFTAKTAPEPAVDEAIALTSGGML